MCLTCAQWMRSESTTQLGTALPKTSWNSAVINLDGVGRTCERPTSTRPAPASTVTTPLVKQQGEQRCVSGSWRVQALPAPSSSPFVPTASPAVCASTALSCLESFLARLSSLSARRTRTAWCASPSSLIVSSTPQLSIASSLALSASFCSALAPEGFSSEAAASLLASHAST